MEKIKLSKKNTNLQFIPTQLHMDAIRKNKNKMKKLAEKISKILWKDNFQSIKTIYTKNKNKISNTQKPTYI